MNQLCRILRLLLPLLLLATVGSTAGAPTEDAKEAALIGLTETKAYFDLSPGDPALLANRLELIDKTHRQLTAAGISTVFVVGVRGKASSYFTKGDDYVLDSDLPDTKRIAQLVDQLTGLGVRFEQCRIAAGIEEIEPTDFLPQLNLVTNGFVSMIGYQTKGYALVPMN